MSRLITFLWFSTTFCLIVATCAYVTLLRKRQVMTVQNLMEQQAPAIVDPVLLPVHEVIEMLPGDQVQFTLPIQFDYWDTGVVVRSRYHKGRYQVLVDDGLWQHWIIRPRDRIRKVADIPVRDYLRLTDYDVQMLTYNWGKPQTTVPSFYEDP